MLVDIGTLKSGPDVFGLFLLVIRPTNTTSFFLMLGHLPEGQLTLLEKVSLSILLAFFKPSHQNPSRQVKLLVIAVSLRRDMT